MNKSDYKAKRQRLMIEAESLLNAGDTKAANEKMADIEKLDAQFESIGKSIANQRAFEDSRRATDLAAMSISDINGTIIDVMGGNILDNRLIATDDYKNAFIKTLQGTGTQEMRNLVTISTGASVIPETTYNKVLEGIRKQQGLLSMVRVLNIPGKVAIPVSDINTAAAWHTEGDAIADSAVPPTSVTLTGYELAKLFSMSAATKAMAIPQYENYLVDELVRTTGDALNDAIFNGTGIGQATGIEELTFDATNLVTAGVKDLDYDDLTAALALMPSNFRQRSVWVMSSTTYYTYVATMADLQGRPLFHTEPVSAAPMLLLGKAVVLDDFAPDDTIYLCDPQCYVINFSEPITVQKSDEAGFSTATTMLRSLCVCDGKPVPGGFVKIAIPQA